MSMSDSDRQALKVLLAAQREGQLTPEQIVERDALLRDHADARQRYLEYQYLCAALHWFYAEVGDTGEDPEAVPVAQPVPLALVLPSTVSEPERVYTRVPASVVRRRLFSRKQLAAVVAACGVMFVGYIFTITWGMFDEKPRAAREWAVGGGQWAEEAGQVAKITASEDAQWRSPEDADAANPPSSILHSPSSIAAAQPLALTSGIVTLELKKGVKLVVQGPARWKIDGANRATLTHGKLIATVPHGAVGFTVKTPTAEIVDLGTEFGVTVDDEGDTKTHVFRGEIRVEQPRLKATTVAAGKSIRLTAGQAVQVDRSGKTTFIEPLASTPAEFIRPPGATAEDNFNPDQPSAFAKYVIDETKPVAYWDFSWYRDSIKIVNDRIAGHPFERFSPRNVGMLGPAASLGFAGFGEVNPAISQESGSVQPPGLRTRMPNLAKGDFSIALWIQPAPPDGKQLHYYVLGNGHGASPPQDGVRDSVMIVGARQPADAGKLGYFNGKNHAALKAPVGTSVLVPGTWYWVVLVRQADKAFVYLNGKLEIESDAMPEESHGDLFAFGQRADLIPTMSYSGLLDDATLWDRALTTSQIAGIYRHALESSKSEAGSQ